MLLREMFSPMGGPKQDQEDIDWKDDLKFYIDNNNDLLNKFMMPAIQKHQKYKGHPSAYKIYIKPLQQCAEDYCRRFDVEEQGKVFDPETIIELAKSMAEQQENFISKGDYAAS